jgi:hypothetical protein
LCLTENRKILFFVSDETPSESGFEIILSDLSVIMNEGGLPLRIFGQQANSSEGSSNSQVMRWFQRQEMADKIRSNLHIFISMSKRSVAAYNSQFYTLFHYALLVNMDNWTRSDLLSYTTTALTLYCEMPKEQIRLYFKF